MQRRVTGAEGNRVLCCGADRPGGCAWTPANLPSSFFSQAQEPVINYAFSFIGPGRLSLAGALGVAQGSGGPAVVASWRTARRGRRAPQQLGGWRATAVSLLADFGPKLIDEADLNYFSQLRAYKKQYPKLKTLISVGGW